MCTCMKKDDRVLRSILKSIKIKPKMFISVVHVHTFTDWKSAEVHHYTIERHSIHLSVITVGYF